MKISLLGSLNDLTSNIISKSLSCPVRNVPDEIGLATGVACQHVDGRLNDGFGGGSLTTVMSSGRSMMMRLLTSIRLCSCIERTTKTKNVIEKQVIELHESFKVTSLSGKNEDKNISVSLSTGVACQHVDCRWLWGRVLNHGDVIR